MKLKKKLKKIAIKKIRITFEIKKNEGHLKILDRSTL
jgi:hypothetical protein